MIRLEISVKKFCEQPLRMAFSNIENIAITREELNEIK
jgi:hypothetical protein